MGHIADDEESMKNNISSLSAQSANVMKDINGYGWNIISINSHNAVTKFNRCMFKIVQSFNWSIDVYVRYNDAHPAIIVPSFVDP
jgi:hypothetical protein